DPTPVVIALGGNIGDVRGTLRAVVADLRTTNGLTVQDVSPLARTAPVLADGAAEQPDFLNAVVLGTTTLSPMDLLATLQDLEEGGPDAAASARQRTSLRAGALGAGGPGRFPARPGRWPGGDPRRDGPGPQRCALARPGLAGRAGSRLRRAQQAGRCLIRTC